MEGLKNKNQISKKKKKKFYNMRKHTGSVQSRTSHTQIYIYIPIMIKRRNWGKKTNKKWYKFTSCEWKTCFLVKRALEW